MIACNMGVNQTLASYISSNFVLIRLMSLHIIVVTHAVYFYEGCMLDQFGTMGRLWEALLDTMP